MCPRDFTFIFGGLGASKFESIAIVKYYNILMRVNIYNFRFGSQIK